MLRCVNFSGLERSSGDPFPSFSLPFFSFTSIPAESAVAIAASACRVYHSVGVVRREKKIEEKKESFERACRATVCMTPTRSLRFEGDLTVEGVTGCDIPSTFIYFLSFFSCFRWHGLPNRSVPSSRTAVANLKSLRPPRPPHSPSPSGEV